MPQSFAVALVRCDDMVDDQLRRPTDSARLLLSDVGTRGMCATNLSLKTVLVEYSLIVDK